MRMIEGRSLIPDLGPLTPPSRPLRYALKVVDKGHDLRSFRRGWSGLSGDKEGAEHVSRPMKRIKQGGCGHDLLALQGGEDTLQRLADRLNLRQVHGPR